MRDEPKRPPCTDCGGDPDECRVPTVRCKNALAQTEELARFGLELAEIICDGALSMGNDYRSELEAKARALREKAESL